MAKDLKLRIKEVGELYYLCSENKGADQLCGYRTTDLRLCFRNAKSRFSHDEAHISLPKICSGILIMPFTLLSVSDLGKSIK